MCTQPNTSHAPLRRLALPSSAAARPLPECPPVLPAAPFRTPSSDPEVRFSQIHLPPNVASVSLSSAGPDQLIFTDGVSVDVPPELSVTSVEDMAFVHRQAIAFADFSTRRTSAAPPPPIPPPLTIPHPLSVSCSPSPTVQATPPAFISCSLRSSSNSVHDNTCSFFSVVPPLQLRCLSPQLRLLPPRLPA